MLGFQTYYDVKRILLKKYENICYYRLSKRCVISTSFYFYFRTSVSGGLTPRQIEIILLCGYDSWTYRQVAHEHFISHPGLLTS
jgi:hypothetical protein